MPCPSAPFHFLCCSRASCVSTKGPASCHHPPSLRHPSPPKNNIFHEHQSGGKAFTAYIFIKVEHSIHPSTNTCVAASMDGCSEEEAEEEEAEEEEVEEDCGRDLAEALTEDDLAVLAARSEEARQLEAMEDLVS